MMLFSENSLKPFTDAADKINKYSIARRFKMSIAKVGVSPHVQPQTKKSPEEARETPVQKRAEKLKPDTFDILL
jgi:hypothetical protein